jgi:transposase-like protein
MTHYPEEFKASIIARMLPPHNASVPALSEETGIPKDTLYGWRIQARSQTGAASGQLPPGGALSSEEKFAIVLETASFNELELGEYCRRKGLYPEQIALWKDAFIQGANPAASRTEREQMQQQTRTIKLLQSELHRKDRALAETAALLVLEKKVQALWTEPEDEKSTSRSAKK